MADHYNTSYNPETSFPTDFLLLNSAPGDESSMLSQLGVSYDDRDSDSVQNNFNLMPYPDNSTTPGPSSLEGPGSFSPPFPLSDSLGVAQLASPQPRARKPPKERRRIDLAPDQPPTIQGHPRARVFVACLQWSPPSPH